MRKTVVRYERSVEFAEPVDIGDLYSVYQPIIKLKSDEIIGYEALVRGRAEFKIPEDLFRASYEDGYAFALDLKCISSAFRALPKLEKGKFLFVNIEPLTLMTLGESHRKVPEATKLFRQNKSYRNQIIFEFTEGMKARDFKEVKKGFSFLSKLGYQFALDDIAGIGLKLLQLLSLKPNFMKLEMGLVQGIAESSLRQDLVRQLAVL